MEIFALILVVVAWLVLCWLGLVFVVVPMTFLALLAGVTCGAALTVVGYARIYQRIEDEHILARPEENISHRLRAPYPFWDKAWPSYLSWQVERDIMAAVTWPCRQANRMWVKGQIIASSNVNIVLGLWPATPAPFGFLAGVTVGAYGGWAVLAAAVEAVLAVPRLLRLSAIGALRAIDTSRRWWQRMAVTCPNCYYVSWLPAYLCGNELCKVVHRDLRPGRLGVWRRRCDCGRHLPTTVLRAAGAAKLKIFSGSYGPGSSADPGAGAPAGPILAPVCSNCGDPLLPEAGIAPDARIVLSGGPAVGKTRLLTRAMAEMARLGDPPSCESADEHVADTLWEPANEQTTTWLSAVQPLTRRGPEEARDAAPKSGLLTFRRAMGGRRQYLHIADLGGHLFETSASDRELWQLSTTRRHLIVLDATGLPAVRDRIVSTGQEARNEPKNPAWAETSVAKVELPYRLLVGQLRRLGARPRRCSLAVVVSKADYLAVHGLAPDQGPDGTSVNCLREWLRTVQLHDLVELAEHDFARVRCFLIGEGWADSTAPFEWLLGQYRHGAGRP